MELGLGLPISNPRRLLDWATQAEAAGFASLGLLDRLVFDNPEPLIALAVLAGATNRVRLQTEVLLGPLRSTPLLAKQVATLGVMAGGRFTLGIGVGGRADDHAAAGTPLAERGRMLDRQLADLRRIWAEGVIGPRPVTAPPVLIGGFAPAALARVARYGDGFLCAAPLQWAGPLVDTVNEQWQAAGRPGRPRLVCQVNVATPAHAERARAAVAEYYAFTGRPGWGAPLTDLAEISGTVAAYRDFGADELVLYCYADDPGQIAELATACHDAVSGDRHNP